MTARIDDAPAFRQHFVNLIARVSGLATSTHGVGPGKCCWEEIAEQSRPREYLQVVLDLLRVVYEPALPGAFQLNSNWDLVADAIPEESFGLGYLTLTSAPGESIEDFARGGFARRMRELGYAFSDAKASFVAACVPASRFSLKENGRVLRAFDGGLRVDQAFEVIQDVSAGEDCGWPRRGGVVAGLAVDDALTDSRVRISAWLFFGRSH